MKKYLHHIISLIVFATVANSVNAQNWDMNLLTQINPRYPSNQTWKTISSTAEPLAASIPVGMIAVALITENKNLELKSYEIAASLGAAVIATGALKVVINRPRPYIDYPNLIHPDEVDNGSSFPSAHTSMAFATATALYLNYKKWYVGVPAFAWASAVGYSRLYLGQHYPSDVLAGAAVGAGSAWICHWANKKLFGKKKK